MSETKCSESDFNALLCVCDCYPKHCEHGDTCWSEPEIIVINDNKIIVHTEVH